MVRLFGLQWACRLLLALLLSASASITPSVARATLDLLVEGTRQLPGSSTSNFEVWEFSVQFLWLAVSSPWFWGALMLWASVGITALAAMTRGSEVSERVLKRKRAVLDEIQSSYDAHVASEAFKEAKQRARTDPSKLTAAHKAAIATGERLLTELATAETEAVEAESQHNRNVTEARQAEAPIAIITDCQSGSGIRRLQFHDTNWTKDGKENRSSKRQHQRAEAHYFTYQRAAAKLTGAHEITDASREAMQARLSDRNVDAETIKELGAVLDIIEEGTSIATVRRMLLVVCFEAQLRAMSVHTAAPACQRFFL